MSENILTEKCVPSRLKEKILAKEKNCFVNASIFISKNSSFHVELYELQKKLPSWIYPLVVILFLFIHWNHLHSPKAFSLSHNNDDDDDEEIQFFFLLLMCVIKQKKKVFFDDNGKFWSEASSWRRFFWIFHNDFWV